LVGEIDIGRGRFGGRDPIFGRAMSAGVQAGRLWMQGRPTAPFYLIVTDHEDGVFAVEGSMTDDRPWNQAALYARNHQRRITCGPTGPDRGALC
jgi:hypothetical protein